MLLYFVIIWLLTAPILPSSVSAGLVNITVDDTNPDPLTGAVFDYSPLGWSFGPSCSGCEAKPDQTKAYDGTWHDATYDPTFDPSNPGKSVAQTASLQYNGSAFYVYGILSESTSDPGSIADIVFLIDGQPIGKFVYTPPGIAGGYSFNVLLYGNDTIPQGQHTFTIQNGEVGGLGSLILLDYIVYSRDDGTSQSSSSSVTSSSSQSSSSSGSATSTAHSSSQSPNQTGSSTASHGISHETRNIVIACVVSAVGAALLLLILFYCLRRRSRTEGGTTNTVMPYSQWVRNNGGEGYIEAQGVQEIARTPSATGVAPLPLAFHSATIDASEGSSLHPSHLSSSRTADGTAPRSSSDTSRIPAGISSSLATMAYSTQTAYFPSSKSANIPIHIPANSQLSDKKRVLSPSPPAYEDVESNSSDLNRR